MILQDKAILVTGAGKGIGLSVIEEALNEGAFVYAITRSKKDIKSLKKFYNTKVYFGDVSNTKLIKKIFQNSIKEKQFITGLVNNAGERQRKKFNKISEKDIKNIFEVNFFSIFNLMQIFSNYLLKKH